MFHDARQTHAEIFSSNGNQFCDPLDYNLAVTTNNRKINLVLDNNYIQNSPIDQFLDSLSKEDLLGMSEPFDVVAFSVKASKEF